MANKYKKALKEVKNKEEHAKRIPTSRKNNANKISDVEKFIYGSAFVIGILDILFFLIQHFISQIQPSSLGSQIDVVVITVICFPIAIICAFILFLAGLLIKSRRAVYFTAAIILAAFIPLFVVLT